MHTRQLTQPIITLGIGFLVALALALLLAVAWLGAPGRDVLDLVQYLLASGLISLGIGLIGLALLRRGNGRLWVQITLTYMLGVAIALFNIFLTAQLMFISADHDFVLLVLLLAFAAVVSLALGYTLARALAQRVTALRDGARALAGGDLAVRVNSAGTDELADLAREFNRMAEQLAAAAHDRSQQEAARRELFAAISHDLRTPLTSLRAVIEALADGMIDDPATTQRYLATMRGQVAHMNELIDDLFELAQIEAGALRLDLVRTAPGDLISDTIEAMQPQASAKGVRLAGSVAPDVGVVLVAPQKLERALFNLVANAIRHTPAGGAIHLCATPDVQRPLIRFEINDTGEGISAADLPHVFERFYRGEKSRSRATGGAGLGLAITRGIIEAHGGTIAITSELGHGTQVHFELPLVV